MKEIVTNLSICPRCHRPYHDRPALSRLDNETLICPDCGTREALASIGVDKQEQDEILEVMHRFPRGCAE
jgi:hydrogenase maturation factor HypF (carbamoyltransferase family)